MEQKLISVFLLYTWFKEFAHDIMGDEKHLWIWIRESIWSRNERLEFVEMMGAIF